MDNDEKKLKKKEYDKIYYISNKEKINKRSKEWAKNNKENAKQSYKEFINKNPEYRKTYENKRRKTQIGRAENLLRMYKQSDKNANRGKCTLTAKWIIENIFTQKCSHCEENDWTKIGCNRLDNNLPHTPENVEPCCFKCNAKLRGKDIIEQQSKQVYQYTLNGDLVSTWSSLHEIEKKLQFDCTCISRCCNGYSKTSYGYKWSFSPLNVN